MERHGAVDRRLNQKWVAVAGAVDRVLRVTLAALEEAGGEGLVSRVTQAALEVAGAVEQALQRRLWTQMQTPMVAASRQN